MLRTINNISIHPRKRLSGQVYMAIVGKIEESRIINNAPVNVVEFTISFSILQNEVRNEMIRIDDEQGGFITEQITKVYPRLVEFDRDVATFRASTFYDTLGNPIPQNYYSIFRNQIEYVNSKEWTGTEIQKIFYWELTANDLEVLTPEQVTQLITPYEQTP